MQKNITGIGHNMSTSAIHHTYVCYYHVIKYISHFKIKGIDEGQTKYVDN